MSAPIWPKLAWKAMRLLAPMTAYTVASYAGGVWLRAGSDRLRWEGWK